MFRPPMKEFPIIKMKNENLTYQIEQMTGEWVALLNTLAQHDLRSQLILVLDHRGDISIHYSHPMQKFIRKTNVFQQNKQE